MIEELTLVVMWFMVCVHLVTSVAMIMTALFLTSYLTTSLVMLQYEPPDLVKKAMHSDKVTAVLIFNLVVLIPLLNMFAEYCVNVSYSLNVGWLVVEMFTASLCYEVLFGLAHFMMHKQGWQIHKLHHEIHEPLGITALYNHPMELIFVLYPSAIAGIMLLMLWQGSVSFWFLCLWNIMMPMTLVWTHSSGPNRFDPLMIRDFHLKHHKNPFKCFGTFSLIDRVLGTHE